MLPLMQLGFDHSKNSPGEVENDTWRFYNTHIVGKPGMGTDRLIKRGVLDDIYRGDGVAFFTPHEEEIEELLPYIPPRRRKDVILYAPADRRWPTGMNIFHRLPREHKPQLVNVVLDVVQGLWPYKMPTPLMEQYFAATTAALLDVPDATVLSVYYMLANKDYRKHVFAHVKDDIVRTFWQDFEKITEKEKRQERSSTFNKVFRFAIDPTVRNIIGQTRPRLDFRDVMDKRIILLVPLPLARISHEE